MALRKVCHGLGEIPICGRMPADQSTHDGKQPPEIRMIQSAENRNRGRGKLQNDKAAARRQIERTVGGDFPNVDINSRSEFLSMQEGTVDQFVAGPVTLNNGTTITIVQASSDTNYTQFLPSLSAALTLRP
jgi:hypothetical protein